MQKYYYGKQKQKYRCECGASVEYGGRCSACLRKTAKSLWEKFEKIPVDDSQRITTSFRDFRPGTHRVEILRWFESTYQVSVVRELMALPENYKPLPRLLSREIGVMENNQ